MCRRTQKGFTLAEVLASVFLLALGVMGAASMQLQALRTAQQSAFQTSALALATEMADVLRMTLTVRDSDLLLKEYLRFDFQSQDESSGSAAGCYGLPCSGEELAEFNMEQWKQRIQSSLPDARVKICLDKGGGISDDDKPDWNCGFSSSSLTPEKASIVVKIGWRDKTRLATHDKTADQLRDFPPLLVLTVAPYVQ